MSDSDEMRFEQGGLAISFSRVGSVATMSWHGTSDSRDPGEFLDPVFRRLLEEVRNGELLIDFSGLDFMNSSTLSPIISMLKCVSARGIRCRVLFSNVDWQQTHMRCLQTIARVLPEVSVTSVPARG